MIENEIENIPFVDIHTHVNFSAYDSDRKEVIDRALSQNVYMMNVGTQQDTSKRAVEIAEEYEKGVYAIIGVHPIHSDACFHDTQELGEGNKEFMSRGEEFDPTVYKELAQHKKVVAVGECGLDYYHLSPEQKEKQTKNFLAQITFANEIQKPLMLHIRKSDDSTIRSAYLDAADILKAESEVPFNVHFFAGTIEETKILLDLGATFSFTGVITFAKQYEELIRYIPIDRMMSETDAPYVTPAPFRGKRNEPVHVIEVVKKMAEIKGVSEDVMKENIWQNVNNFFDLR